MTTQLSTHRDLLTLAGTELGTSGWVGMDHVAENRVTDIAGLHACPAYRLPHHGRREVAGRDGGEAAAEFADRGPDSGQHHYIPVLFHDHFPHMSRPPLTAQICPVM
jgi:hypothetical protein